MASTTVKKIIKKAMQKSGILTKFQEPAADEYSDAVDNLTDMVESWGNDSMNVIARSLETFPITSGIGSYQIGIGQTFNTQKPINIIAATITFGGMDYPLSIISDEVFLEQIMLKSQQGITQYLNFNNAYPIGILKMWPIPSGITSITILSEKSLSAFGINDTVDLPPGWNRALIYNLARELASDYGQTPPDETVRIAVESKTLIQKAIIKNRDFDSQPATVGSNNIYSGYYNR